MKVNTCVRDITIWLLILLQGFDELKKDFTADNRLVRITPFIVLFKKR